MKSVVYTTRIHNYKLHFSSIIINHSFENFLYFNGKKRKINNNYLSAVIQMTYIHELCCTFSHGVTLLKTIKLKIIKKNNFHLSKYVVVSLKERYKSKVKEEKKQANYRTRT